MRNLTLIIPDLSKNLNQEIASPSLKKLLARSKSYVLVKPGHESFLLNEFGLSTEGELPIAAITGLADNLSTQNNYWVRIDPVEFRADLATVYLLGNEHLINQSIDIKEINSLLSLDQLKFYAPHPLRWYLELTEDPKIQTYPLAQVSGKIISEYLPTGINQSYWRKLMTELQMLLHNNRNGQANGVWLWGGGYLPGHTRKEWQGLFGTNILLRGLGKLNEVTVNTSPNAFAELLANMQSKGDYLLFLDVKELKQLERDWFKPIVNALRRNKLTSLKLYLGGNVFYEITSTTIWYFWKK